MTKQIAIIGAGMAGLAAAQFLARSGFSITLFEKSRGLGGRMATRRVNNLQFDHGAQYFMAKGARFRAIVAQWLEVGDAAEWFDGAFVGTPGMTAPARALAEGLSVIFGSTVTGLRHDDGGWSVYATNGLIQTPGNCKFSAVMLAVPAPQAAPLAASAGVVLPQLEKVRSCHAGR